MQPKFQPSMDELWEEFFKELPSQLTDNAIHHLRIAFLTGATAAFTTMRRAGMEWVEHLREDLKKAMEENGIPAHRG